MRKRCSLANFFPWSTHRKEKVKRKHDTVSQSWGTLTIYDLNYIEKSASSRCSVSLSYESCNQSKVTTLQET